MNSLTNTLKYRHAIAWLALILVACALLLANAGTGVRADSSCFQSPAGLVAWYPLDGNANDIQGGNNATISGTPVFTTGKVAQALQFDGNTVSAKVNATSGINIGAGNGMTIDAWINPMDVTTTQPIVEWNSGVGGNPYGVHLFIDTTNVGAVTGNLFANIVDSNGNYHYFYTATGTLVANAFQHVAVSYDKSDGAHGYARLYVNGVSLALNGTNSNVVDLGVFTPQTSYDLFFGLRPAPSTFRFKGLMDEIELYNRALSPSEMQAIYNAGSAVRCAPPDRIQFSSATYSHIANGAALLNVTRTDAQNAAGVQYATSDGTAQTGVDYTATSGTLNFAPGELSKTISIPIATKTVPGPDKTVNVTLSNPTGDGVLGATSNAVLTINGAVGRILFGVGNDRTYGLVAINADAGGSNRINLTDLRFDDQLDYPSVSAQTGLIAFQGCGVDIPSNVDCSTGTRIFTMNADGTGMKQLTFADGLQNPSGQSDHSPVISPDGTKIAFISRRLDASQNDEVFVVNVDGTGLHQVTSKQNIPNSGTNSRAYSVAWSPDGSKLAVRATRLYHQVVDGDAIVDEVLTVNLDGSGEKPLTVNTPARDLQTGDVGIAPNKGQFIDWSPDGNNIVFAVELGGYPNYRTGYVIMNPANPSSNYLLTDTQLGGTGASTSDGSVRFSPDSQKLLYGLAGSDYTSYSDFGLRTINLDGTSSTVIVAADYPFYDTSKWWAPGPAIPKPDHFTLTPNPLVTYNGFKQQLTPTLYDAEGNVIIHAGVHNNDDLAPLSGGVKIDFNFLFTGKSNNVIGQFCASNAGLSGCTTVNNTDAALSVAATTPTASNKDQTPGVFTITRQGASTASLTIHYKLSGTATLGGDYTTDVPANVFTFPANQTSVTIRVTPTGNSAGHGDRTVIFTLLPADSNQYAALSQKDSATVTIKDDGASTNALNLTSITPNAGGVGGFVTATIYGANIKPGATVTLNGRYMNNPLSVGTFTYGVSDDGTALTIGFSHPYNAPGAYDVVVKNPDGTTATLPNGFTFQANSPAQLWLDLVGRHTLRGGLPETFYIVYGNRGNVDLLPTRIAVIVPPELKVDRLPILENGSAPNLSIEEDGSSVLTFYTPGIRANSVTYLPLQVTASDDSHDAHKIVVTELRGLSLSQLYDPSELGIDPSVTTTQELLVDTNTYAKGVVHYNSSSGSDDVTWESTITPASAPADPVVNVTDDGTNLIYEITGTIPATSLSPAAGNAPAKGAASVKMTPNDFFGKFVAVKNVIYRKKRYDAAEHAKGELTEAIEEDINLKKLADCLLKKGYVNDATALTIGNFADGHVAIRGVVTALEAKEVFETPGVFLFKSQAVQALDGLGGILKAGPSQLIAHDLARRETPYQQLATDATTGSFLDGGRTKAREELINKLLAECSSCISKKKASALKSDSNIDSDIEPCEQPTPTPTPTPVPTPPLPVPPPPAQPPAVTPQPPPTDVSNEIVVSGDPNEKDGSQGAGIEHFVSGAEPLRYFISFENVATATAPAQTVVVTDQLDPTKVDLSTFSLASFNIASNGSGVPNGLSSYTKDIDLRPQQNLIVRSSAQLNKNTGLLTWKFQTIDPATGQPTTDPLAGFLPPDKNAPEGQGGIAFSVMPKAGLATGTEIRNKARIIFDANAPIDTNEYLNTIDNSNPASHAKPLNATQPFVIFNVTWGGTDTGSGVRDYTVYSSENGGAYTVWLDHTTQTSANFIGQPQKSYTFYTLATDNANNQEPVKTTAEAGTATRTDIANSIDDTRFYVRQHYLDFLSREPDQAGWDFWTNNIESCGSNAGCRDAKRVDTSAAYFLSIEFQQTGYLVYRAYKTAYGNVPNTPVPVRFTEFLPDTQSIGQGVVVGQAGWEAQLETNKAAYFNAFVTTARFTNLYPQTLTAGQYVDALNANAGGVLTLAERDALVNGLAGAETRATVLRKVSENAALQSREFNKAFVLMQYFGYLRRDPDTAPDADFGGYNFWLSKLNGFNGDYRAAEMVKAFIVSSEYRKRFGLQ